MKVPQLARYNGTVSTAYKFTEENIIEFPVNLIKLIKKFKWGLLTYEDMSLKQGCTINDICQCLGKDGYSIYNGNSYTIAYNNTIKPHYRINFTLAHEIGHIILGHHKDFDVTSILKDNFTKEEYKILENEANCFARNILAPAPLVKQFPFWNIFDISNNFNLTFAATYTRLSFLKNDLYYLTDIDILNMQQKYNAYLVCDNCNYKFINKNSKYCPICGKNELAKKTFFAIQDYIKIKGELKNKMNYTCNYKIDENSRLTQCPICHNEEITVGEYCKICGTYLINKCTNIIEDTFGNQLEGSCGKLAEANARYCIYCGNETTFYKKHLLCDYKDYDIDQENLKVLWHNTLNDLKSNGKIVLYTNLLCCYIQLINSTSLSINFTNISIFGKTVLLKEENINEIKKIINKNFGQEFSINFYDENKKVYFYEENTLPS